MKISDMPPLEGNEEVKSEPKETIVERTKLKPQKKKKNRNRIKNLDSKQIITRLPILLPQIKAGDNSYKLNSYKYKLN